MLKQTIKCDPKGDALILMKTARMCELDLRISYDKVLQLENQLATAVYHNMEKKAVVCPAQLHKGLFTT